MAEQPNTDDNLTDQLVPYVKGALGAIPLIGSLAAELIGNIIPNQRIERITKFLEILNDRVRHLELTKLNGFKTDSAFVDIMEDAFTQAARATGVERLVHISNLVANGISEEQSNHAETKRMLWLLGQLNDQEVVLLRGRLPRTREDWKTDQDYQSLHASILEPDIAHLGSSEDELEEAALKSSYRQHLHDLGLLRTRFNTPRKGEMPEFDDKTGLLKASGSEVSRLGRMLLRYLDLLPTWYSY